MNIVVRAAVPRLIMLPTIVLTIVIALFVALRVATIMDYLTVAHYAAR